MAFDDQGDGRHAARDPVGPGPRPHDRGPVRAPAALAQRGAPVRQVLAPVTSPASVLMVLLLLTLIADLSGLSDEVEVVFDVAGLVSLVLIPFAFLGGLLRSRLSRAGAVSELVTRLSERDARRSGLRDALADALGDPGLTLLYWLPSRGRYVNAEGQPVELPAPFEERVATVVEDHGSPVAAIVHDASLRRRARPDRRGGRRGHADARERAPRRGAARQGRGAARPAPPRRGRGARRAPPARAQPPRRRPAAARGDGAEAADGAHAGGGPRPGDARSCSRPRRPSWTPRSRSCASWRAASTPRCSATAGLDAALEALAHRVSGPGGAGGHARRAAARGRGDGRLLRGGRGADQRGQVRVRHPRDGEGRARQRARGRGGDRRRSGRGGPVEGVRASRGWPTGSARWTAASRSMDARGGGTIVRADIPC